MWQTLIPRPLVMRSEKFLECDGRFWISASAPKLHGAKPSCRVFHKEGFLSKLGNSECCPIGASPLWTGPTFAFNYMVNWENPALRKSQQVGKLNFLCLPEKWLAGELDWRWHTRTNASALCLRMLSDGVSTGRLGSPLWDERVCIKVSGPWYLFVHI